MTILPPHYLDAVAALGVPAPGKAIAFTATGFLYGHPTATVGDSTTYHIFLVTNRHVIESAGQLGVRLNCSGAVETKVYGLPSPRRNDMDRWTTHPDGDCDVAVLPMAVDQLRDDGIEFDFFPGDQQITLDRARSLPVSEGDGVFVLGFPLGMAGDQRNHPIVRQGIVARIRDWLQDASRTILIDASVFPGNSGGPVVTKPEIASLKGTPANKEALLIGMVSSYVAHPSDVGTRPASAAKLISRENSGLAYVVPVDVIRETVDLAMSRINSSSGNEVAQPTARNDPAQGRTEHG